MARISKADHPRILQLADSEGRKVAEIAAAFGCSPANIYVLLGKLRRAGAAAPQPDAVPAPPAEAPPSPASPPATDLFAPAPAAAPPPPAEPRPRSATVTELPARAEPPARGGIGARLAKPGYGLLMRTADGEDSMAPFRSLDDLLTAIKPILRSAARSPDPVWFSIQPIDLAAVDIDAA